jgi:hypothetical protein
MLSRSRKLAKHESRKPCTKTGPGTYTGRLHAPLAGDHRRQRPHSHLATALGHDLKGKISLAAYIVSVPVAFLNPWISVALYIVVALLWFVPDRRIEAPSHS